MNFDPQQILDSLSTLPDEEIDLGLAALALAALEQPGLYMDRYVHHFDVLAQDVANFHMKILASKGPETVENRLISLQHVLCELHAYVGDKRDYDSFENLSLIRVIDRAKGIPISLCILYIQAARNLGWDIAGLNIPGHFVCRLDMDGQRVIFDPFENCRVLEASDLRLLVKRAMGNHAELSAQYFEPAPNREILIRLQNNIKHRQIADEDYEGALRTVERMQAIDPKEFRLLLDAGVLFAKVDQTGAAIQALERYIGHIPKNRSWDADRHDAEMLLGELRGRLN